MQNRTINGKNFNEILKELQKPFEKEWFNYEKNSYIPSEHVEQRLDDVLGLNYSFEIVSEPELLQFAGKKQTKNKQIVDTLIQAYVSIGVISIYDDQGVLVSKRSCGGKKNIITINDLEDTIKDIGNDFKSCITDAFKKCAKAFGVGRYLDIKYNKNQGKNISGDNKPDNRGTNNQSQSNDSTANDSTTSEIKLRLKSKAKSDKKGLTFDVVDGKGRQGTLTVLKFKCREHIFRDQLQFHADDVAV
jgi:stress-induced morphogen